MAATATTTAVAAASSSGPTEPTTGSGKLGVVKGVGTGEQVTLNSRGPGEFAGVCTVHPSGEFVLVVNP